MINQISNKLHAIANEKYYQYLLSVMKGEKIYWLLLF